MVAYHFHGSHYWLLPSWLRILYDNIKSYYNWTCSHDASVLILVVILVAVTSTNSIQSTTNPLKSYIYHLFLSAIDSESWLWSSVVIRDYVEWKPFCRRQFQIVFGATIWHHWFIWGLRSKHSTHLYLNPQVFLSTKKQYSFTFLFVINFETFSICDDSPS